MKVTYDIYMCRLLEWRRKISKSDSLRYDKREAIEVAIGLGYSDQTLNNIVYASSDIQISRALTTARQSAQKGVIICQ